MEWLNNRTHQGLPVHQFTDNKTMEYLVEFLLFFAKTLIVIIAVVIPIMLISALASRQRQHQKEHLEVNHINRRYETMSNTINAAHLPKKAFKEKIKQQKKERKASDKGKTDPSGEKNRVYVFRFKGDLEASEIDLLREEITAVLTVAEPSDEIVVDVESRGGVVHGYGLAASQLKRIKDKNIKLTVSVDKVAASGGYLMACVADKIIAAPFAIVGSVGVLAQIPNFHRVLDRNDIEFQEFKAGEHKRTVGMFSEPTEKGNAKFMEEIEDIHKLFKDFVKTNRPQLDIDKIATGEHWFGTRALDLNLIDELRTSDDYLLEASEKSEIFEVKYIHKVSLAERINPAVAGLIKSLLFRNQSSSNPLSLLR